jgi:hypothetical protein
MKLSVKKGTRKSGEEKGNGGEDQVQEIRES